MCETGDKMRKYPRGNDNLSEKTKQKIYLGNGLLERALYNLPFYRQIKIKSRFHKYKPKKQKHICNIRPCCPSIQYDVFLPSGFSIRKCLSDYIYSDDLLYGE